MPDPQVTVNGQPRALAGTPVHTNALDFLRGLGLTGAKEGCAEGECGACAVLLSRPGADATTTEWVAVNSCLVPVAALDGQEVVTAEGLGSPDRLHPVQRELADRGGTQCGYCTPGFVMATEMLIARLRVTPIARAELDQTIEEAVGQHICRCTGYARYQAAIRAVILEEKGLVR